MIGQSISTNENSSERIEHLTTIARRCAQWKSFSTDVQLAENAGIELTSIYTKFIDSGYQWDGLLPVIAGTPEFITEVRALACYASVHILQIGIHDITAGLRLGQKARTKILDAKRFASLCRFAEALGRDLDVQHAIATGQSSDGAQSVILN